MFKIIIFAIGVIIVLAGIIACLSFFREDEHEERTPFSLRVVIVVFG